MGTQEYKLDYNSIHRVLTTILLNNNRWHQYFAGWWSTSGKISKIWMNNMVLLRRISQEWRCSTFMPCGKDKWKYENKIDGAGENIGDPSTICSLRPEHTGAIASNIVVAISEHKYKLKQTKGYLNLGIDNTTVVNRWTDNAIDDLGEDSQDKTDYYLWKESMAINSKMTTTVTTMHIKAHQDDVLRKDFGRVGPMNQHATHNITVYKIAQLKRET